MLYVKIYLKNQYYKNNSAQCQNTGQDHQVINIEYGTRKHDVKFTDQERQSNCNWKRSATHRIDVLRKKF